MMIGSTMSELERVLAALIAMFGDGAEFTAGEVLKRTRLAGAPKQDELRAALESAIGPKFSGVTKLGQWLAAHRDKAAGGLRLGGDYDTHVKRWKYFAFKMATPAEIEAGLQETAREFERRQSEAMRKGLAGQLKWLEGVVSKREQFAAPVKPHGRTAYFERQRAYREQEQERETEKALPKKYYLLVPSPGSRHFSHEPTAQSVARHVRELGFGADVIFSPGGGHLVQVFDVDRAEADAIAKKLRRAVVESEAQQSASRPHWWNEVTYDAKHNRYVPKATAGTAAVAHDPALRIVRQMFATNDADRKPQQGMFNWNPFNLR